MIYTVTLNPSVDYYMLTDFVAKGQTNRSRTEEICFGGKGINVSIVLKRLGFDNVVLGFIGGFTGDALEQAIRDVGVQTDFYRLENAITRINVKLIGDTETEINAVGPCVTENDISGFLKKLKQLNRGDTLVLSGSVPRGCGDDIYANIAKTVEEKQIRLVVDATGDLLKNTLCFKPFLIKPNLAELSELSGKVLDTEQKIIFAAKELKMKGAVNVLVSRGDEGAIFIDENYQTYKIAAVKGKTVSTVGAGDSMIAGFLAGIDNSLNTALRLAVSAGGATACTKGLATKDEIMRFYEHS